MRITSIELTCCDEQILTGALRAPGDTDRFLVKAIYGLDADELVPKFYGFGANTGTPFYRFGMKTREIVMRLVLAPNWENSDTYSSVRDQLYRAISKSRNGTVELQLKSTATTVAVISGQIVKFEVPHFNQDPELQITIRCEDPVFRSLTDMEYVDADFDSTGYISIPDQVSTAPHGFEMQVTFLKDAFTGFTIQDDSTYDWRFHVTAPPNYSDKFQLNDVLYFKSEYGKKELWVQRFPAKQNLMEMVSMDSVWPVIFPGDNEFYLPQYLNADYTIDFIRFKSAYWGV